MAPVVVVTLLLGVFLTAVLSALSSGQRAGWEAYSVLAEFAVSAVAIVAFVGWEWRTAKPMLDLRLFANGSFLAAAAVSFVLGAGLFGTTYLLPVFVQTIQGMTPTEAGLTLYDHAKQMLQALDAMAEVADTGRLRGRLRIAAPATFGTLYLAPSLYRFLARHPDLELALDLDDRYVDLTGYDLGVRIGRLKDSSLVSVIGLTELARTGQELASRYAAPLTIWPLVALLYLVLTFPLARLAERLERRWRPITRV